MFLGRSRILFFVKFGFRTDDSKVLNAWNLFYSNKLIATNVIALKRYTCVPGLWDRHPYLPTVLIWIKDIYFIDWINSETFYIF